MRPSRRRIILGSLFLSLLAAGSSSAAVCATPGKDGPGGTLRGIVNSYYPGVGTAPAGNRSIGVGAPGAGPAIASGDLLLVIQIQDASIDSTNSSSYGDGLTGGAASGSTSLGASGQHEFVVSDGPVTGGAVAIRGTGAGEGLVFSYSTAPKTATSGQVTYQIVRVPQYTTATLSSTLTALPWNGSVGGILAIDVSGVLTVGGTVSVDGLGFRGGIGRSRTTGTGGLLNTDYRTLSNQNPNGEKAEGIAGTPGGLVGAAAGEGYPRGDYARGAPGNAGGGATDGAPATDNSENSGGGGGGNVGVGGVGGNSWSSNLPRGGYGGAAFPSAPGLLVLGGGGGAGSNNNNPGQSSGGAGGGIVHIRALSVSGSGVITANGTTVDTAGNDGGGGSGAGGSVVLVALNGGLGGVTLSADGGRGGNTNLGAAMHGPGGGGGGGYVALTSPAGTVSVSGGASGLTGTPPGVAYGATGGSTGGSTTTLPLRGVPGVHGGAECLPPSCVSVDILRNADVKTTKEILGRSDIVFIWIAGAGGVEQHLNSVTRKTDIPDPRSKRVPTGVGATVCTVPVSGCTVLAAVTTGPSPTFFQAYGACGPTGADEGAF